VAKSEKTLERQKSALERLLKTEKEEETLKNQEKS
jgi:hypothetical protein